MWRIHASSPHLRNLRKNAQSPLLKRNAERGYGDARHRYMEAGGVDNQEAREAAITARRKIVVKKIGRKSTGMESCRYKKLRPSGSLSYDTDSEDEGTPPLEPLAFTPIIT